MSAPALVPVVQRMIYRCPRCKSATRIDWHYSSSEWHASAPVNKRNPYARQRCACGGLMWEPRRIEGTKSDHACDSRCTSARGHECECSCEGRNHGIDHMPLLAQ